METKTVEMTKEQLEAFERFQADEKKKAAAERAKQERESYKQLVEEAINMSIPELDVLSSNIAKQKEAVMCRFNSAIEMKHAIFGLKKDGQRSHTFTNEEGTKRITVGQYCLDGWLDTVNEGIAIVKEYLSSLAKDRDSKALVSAILRLMSRDNEGNLKASRVLQLRRMAEESGNERFMEGVRIIEESYTPVVSKRYIKAETRTEDGAWRSIPLGMTEA